jgi:hypothetical protein
MRKWTAALSRLRSNFAKFFKVATIILIHMASLSSATSVDRLARASSGPFNMRGEQAMAILGRGEMWVRTENVDHSGRLSIRTACDYEFESI